MSKLHGLHNAESTLSQCDVAAHGADYISLTLGRWVASAWFVNKGNVRVWVRQDWCYHAESNMSLLISTTGYVAP